MSRTRFIALCVTVATAAALALPCLAIAQEQEFAAPAGIASSQANTAQEPASDGTDAEIQKSADEAAGSSSEAREAGADASGGSADSHSNDGAGDSPEVAETVEQAAAEGDGTAETNTPAEQDGGASIEGAGGDAPVADDNGEDAGVLPEAAGDDAAAASGDVSETSNGEADIAESAPDANAQDSSQVAAAEKPAAIATSGQETAATTAATKPAASVAKVVKPAKKAASAPVNPYAAEDAKAKANKGKIISASYLMIGRTAGTKVASIKGDSRAAGAAACIYTYGSLKSQGWTIVFDSKGYAVIKSKSTGLVLSVKGGSMKNGVAVVQSKNLGKRYQRWIITMNKNGTCRIESALKVGYSVQVVNGSKADGAQLVMKANNSTVAQQFTMQRMYPVVPKSARIASGWYTVQSTLNKAYSLYVKGLGNKDGTAIQLAKGMSSAGCAFKIKRVGNYYQIVAGIAPKSPVVTNAKNVLPGQVSYIALRNTKDTLYSLVYYKSLGGYQMVNVKTGLALGVSMGKATQGARITGQHALNGAKAQVFVLKGRPGLLTEGVYAMRTVMKGKRAVSAYQTKSTFNVYAKDFEQKWYVSPVKGKPNTYTFESLANGTRLTAVAGGTVQVAKASTAASQMWSPCWMGNGFGFTNAATKRALSVKGKAVTENLAVMNKGAALPAAKTFLLNKVATVNNGTYEFLSASNTAYAVDVADWSKKSGGTVIVWDTTGNANQRWVFNATTGTLSNENSGKLLDAVKTKDGKYVIQQRTKSGAASQKWSIQYAGAGKFRLVSGLGSSLVLTASAAQEYGQLSVSADKKANLQRWRFYPASSGGSYTGFKVIKSIVSNGHGSLNASYVVIHETANPGATAKNHRDYWNNDDTYAVHYVLDWTGNCYYCVPENRLCWQVGNGNSHVVGIELCHATTASNFKRVWDAGVQWAAWQLKKHGWGINRLISHNECRTKWGGTDHTDPDDYFAKYGRSWSQFKSAVRAVMAK